jgi:hypothetical protein
MSIRQHDNGNVKKKTKVAYRYAVRDNIRVLEPVAEKMHKIRPSL